MRMAGAEDLIVRLEKAVSRLESVSSSTYSSRALHNYADDHNNDITSSHPSILAFDDLFKNGIDRVVGVAQKINEKELTDVTIVFQQAFASFRSLLIHILRLQKPNAAGLTKLLEPLHEAIMKANAMTEGKHSDYFNHQKSVADSLSALLWIAYTGKNCGMSMPIAHVEESWQMAEFYNNKILTEYKNKDPNHVEWAKAMKEVFIPGLRDYVKTYYPLGPVWNPSGGATVSAAPKAAPAPPPAPSAALFSCDSAKPSSSKGMAAVFNEISSGDALTSGLRKVTDDMKSKNRADRSGVVPVTEKQSQVRSVAISKTGPPKMELLMGRKWAVENQIGRKDLVIDDCDSKQTVYVFGCKDSVLQIKEKVNNITIDKCTKMGILFKDVVAACEIVNCSSVEVQCQGSAPTISVDNTSGCQIYLSKDSLETSITTAKSSEINVMVPASETDGDWGEHSLPQQYIHIFKDGQFLTTPMSHSGA